MTSTENHSGSPHTSEAIFQQALTSEYGIRVEFSSREAALRARRKLYAYAAAHKPLKEMGLSILHKGNALKLIKRKKAKEGSNLSPVNISPLSAADIPPTIRARGASKFVFHHIS